MKGYIKRLLREGLLTEKLHNVDTDVNDIYDIYFRDDIEEIEKTGIITKDMFQPNKTTTRLLTSQESVDAHKVKPCIIYINTQFDGIATDNFYKPDDDIISLGVNTSAIGWVLRFDGDIKEASNALVNSNQKNRLPFEFTEQRIKGSINHELYHWLDDVNNNYHITKRLNIKKSSRIPVNTEKFEIQGQMGNIKQLKNTYDDDIWNELSFNDIISKLPSLNNIYYNLNLDYRDKWVRDLKHRMSREGLLGKGMVYNN